VGGGVTGGHSVKELEHRSTREFLLCPGCGGNSGIPEGNKMKRHKLPAIFQTGLDCAKPRKGGNWPRKRDLQITISKGERCYRSAGIAVRFRLRG